MKNILLKKEHLDGFIKALADRYKVAAPVKKGTKSYTFEFVNGASEVSLEHIPTILPPKKYFLPQHETLLEYDTTEGQNMHAFAEIEPMVIFGVQSCDLAGIQCLNHVFMDRPKDYHYQTRHDKILLIGYECMNKCDEFASCGLMNTHMPTGGYDLFISDIGEYYYFNINTLAGERLTALFGGFEPVTAEAEKLLKKLRTDKKKLFKNETDVALSEIPSIFEWGFDSHVWNRTAEKCLSCGNCTNVCPTCYCFDVKDESELNLNKGRRIRVWDSCQNESFALVAGGENFREKRAERVRHRFFRKFKYPVDRYGKFFCTGCGRCSRQCMASINLKETISKLKSSWGEL